MRIKLAGNGWAVPVHYCGLLVFILNGAVISSAIQIFACGVQQGNKYPGT